MEIIHTPSIDMSADISPSYLTVEPDSWPTSPLYRVVGFALSQMWDTTTWLSSHRPSFQLFDVKQSAGPHYLYETMWALGRFSRSLAIRTWHSLPEAWQAAQKQLPPGQVHQGPAWWYWNVAWIFDTNVNLWTGVLQRITICFFSGLCVQIYKPKRPHLQTPTATSCSHLMSTVYQTQPTNTSYQTTLNESVYFASKIRNKFTGDMCI